jgi:hypothetical protein
MPLAWEALAQQGASLRIVGLAVSCARGLARRAGGQEGSHSQLALNLYLENHHRPAGSTCVFSSIGSLVSFKTGLQLQSRTTLTCGPRQSRK